MLSFEWEKNKETKNIEKHCVTFKEAATVFFDDNAILIDDPDHSVSEERFILLGISMKARILVVCHCLRNNEQTIRIISARKATKTEAKQYTEVTNYETRI